MRVLLCFFYSLCDVVVDEGPEVGHAGGRVVGGWGGQDAVGRGWVDAWQPGEAGEEWEWRRVVAEKLHRALSRVLLFHREETLDCLLPVPRAASPLLAVVVVQFGRVSRPGLARRTVGLPASQPGPARRRFRCTRARPRSCRNLQFCKASTHRTSHFLAVSLRPSVVVGKCSHKYQGFHGYITLKKKKKVGLAGLPWLQLLADSANDKVGFLDLSAPSCSSVKSAGGSGGSRRCSAEAECWTECSGSEQQQARRWGLRPHRVLWGRLRRRCCCTQTAETAPKKAAPTQTGQGLGGGGRAI